MGRTVRGVRRRIEGGAGKEACARRGRAEGVRYERAYATHTHDLRISESRTGAGTPAKV